MAHTVTVGGIPTTRMTRAELARQMVSDCQEARTGSLALPRLIFSSNGSVIAAFHRHREFRNSLAHADIVDADGMPLIMATRLLCRVPLRERVATTDFIHDAATEASAAGLRFYFLGAAPNVAEQAMVKLRARHPALQVVGTRHGYFSAEEEPGICEDVVRRGTDVLWVGLGSPRQEMFAVANRARLPGLGWIRTCGGLFDHCAGSVRRAPDWMQSAGLEWLHRATLEPLRLGPRYLSTNPRAAFHLMTKTHD
ncbi:WecB/TagA/CpsF family glycosyltransferase [Falsiroseomonas sp. HC035]|uniref:WecB/TagA/CpsF family glycosyltransferase n=1 Tax=Falsiroseomonas sp. HC035 TaxID=3390999 RepID=UPI003D31844F